MSLTALAVNLYDRLTIERDANAATADSWGQSQPADWQPHLADVPCRFWFVNGQEIVEGEATVTPVEDARAVVPLGTDVTEADRIASVTYGGGTGQDGPLGVRAVLTRRNHIELVLVRAA